MKCGLVQRRGVICGGLAALVPPIALPRKAEGATYGTGCWIPPSEVKGYFHRATQANMFEYGSEQMEPRSGNKDLDKSLAQALATIAKEFQVLPSFSYYHDDGQPNAMATPDHLLGGTDGTVLFGLDFLKILLQRPGRSDASIIAVCAHEFGHIVSYKNDMISTLAPNHQEPFRAEQFADYMAGFYAGRRKLVHSDFPAASFASTQYAFGGGDHGTNKQRGDAVQQGYFAAYRDHKTLDEATQSALAYCMNE